MDLNESITVDYQALSHGPVQVQKKVSIVFNGQPMSSTQHYVLNPGDDLTDQPDEVRAACEAWWTPERVATWQGIIGAQGDGL